MAGDDAAFSDTKHHRNGTLRSATTNSWRESYDSYLRTHPNAKLIGIDGRWYDIAAFIPHHPGGAELISHFVGKDATPVFRGLHNKDVLRHMRPVAAYRRVDDDPAGEAFAQLHRFFIDHGFFKTSAVWYSSKFAFAIALLATAVYLVANWHTWFWNCIAGCCLALFWQQCGFFLHDFMHSQGFHERRIDNWIGLISGTLGLGVSCFWWQEEHYVHHALSNTVDHEIGFHDPQMREETWAQNEKLFPFFKTWIQRRMISVQHWIFIPACMIFGRSHIVYRAYRNERRPLLWLLLFLHFGWLYALLRQLPTWDQAAIVYSVAQTLQGIIHVQLLVSHYCKPFFQRRDICEGKNWYRLQIECNVNIKNPVWMDWFHGGLNFHIEHHLFPLMPRHRFREASRYIRATCHQLGIEYDECDVSTAIVRTLRRLRQMAVLFTMDPR